MRVSFRGDLVGGSLMPQGKDQSLARHKFVDGCETTINEQINVEYNASYAYHSLFAYFDRDNVALKGFAKFFKESRDEEHGHAEKLMEYQNKRGGRVRLQSIVTPLTEFDHPEKGDALYAMELALDLEKLVNEKLHNLHSGLDVEQTESSSFRSSSPFSGRKRMKLLTNKLPDMETLCSVSTCDDDPRGLQLFSGFMGAMISNLAFVFRNIFSKQVMKGKSVSGMNYYDCLSIMSLVILTSFAIAMEGPQMWAVGWQKALAEVGPNVLWWIGAQSVFYHLYNQVSYMSLDQISPLTFSIGNTMKRISVIVSSIIIFRTPVRPVNALGVAIAIFGTFLYSKAKQ